MTLFNDSMRQNMKVQNKINGQNASKIHCNSKKHANLKLIGKKERGKSNAKQ